VNRIMYYGLKRAFPDLVVVSEEREPQDSYVPMPNIDNPVSMTVLPALGKILL
jgi:hypothetical protein